MTDNKKDVEYALLIVAGLVGTKQTLFYLMDGTKKITDNEIVLNVRLNGRPGSVYKFEIAKRDPETGLPNSFMVPKNPILSFVFSDDPRVVTWQAVYDAEKNAKKKLREGQTNLVRAQLEPLRDAYSRLNATQKRALIAYVIQYITTGK